MLLMTTLCIQHFRQFSINLIDHLPTSYFIILSVGDTVEIPTKIKTNNIPCFSLLHWLSYFLVEDFQVDKAWVPLYNSCPSYVWTCLFQKDLLSLVHGNKMRLTGLLFTRSFLPVLKIAMVFSFLQSLNCHDLSAIIESSLSMASASSLSQLWLHPFGSMCLSTLFKCSLGQSSWLNWFLGCFCSTTLQRQSLFIS